MLFLGGYVCIADYVLESVFKKKKIIDLCCHPHTLFGECLRNACACWRSGEE